MIKKINSFLIFIIVIFSLIYTKPRIAVIEFEGAGVDKTSSSTITDRFLFELSKTNRFDILEREMMNKILNEQKFQNSGCVKQECIVKIGELIAVQQIVTGTISKIEDFYSLNIRLIDVQTGEIVYQDMDDFEGRISDFMKIAVKNSALRMSAEMSHNTGMNKGDKTTYSTTVKGIAIFNLNLSNVAIFVDDRYSSRSSGKKIKLSLTEGIHHIKFSKDGYKDFEKEVNILPNEELNYNVELKIGSSRKQEEILTGILMVRSEPSNAIVFVDGVEKGITLLQIADIGIGEHEIRIEKNLYYPYAEIVTIAPDAIIEVQASLKSRFGKLVINTNPSGAVIKINGQTKGRSPVMLNQLASGTYSINISKELYHTHREKFEITDGSDNIRNINLIPAFGRLEVKSNPTGGEVFIDGQFKGITPISLNELPSGNYNIKIIYPLYETVEKEIIIEDGQLNKQNYKLEARSGTLTILGKPTGASVFINNIEIGKLPLNDIRLSEGMAEIKISSTDYHSKVDYINIRRNKHEKLNTNLIRHYGKLIIITEPPEAEIFLDGEHRGKSPQILNDIPTGSHKLEIKHSEFLNESNEFNLLLNEKKEFRFELMTYEGSIQEEIDKLKQRRRRYIWAAITSFSISGGSQYFSTMSYNDYENASTTLDAEKFYNYSIYGNNVFVGGASIGILLIPQIIKITFKINTLEKSLN